MSAFPLCKLRNPSKASLTGKHNLFLCRSHPLNYFFTMHLSPQSAPSSCPRTTWTRLKFWATASPSWREEDWSAADPPSTWKTNWVKATNSLSPRRYSPSEAASRYCRLKHNCKIVLLTAGNYCENLSWHFLNIFSAKKLHLSSSWVSSGVWSNSAWTVLLVWDCVSRFLFFMWFSETYSQHK